MGLDDLALWDLGSDGRAREGLGGEVAMEVQHGASADRAGIGAWVWMIWRDWTWVLTAARA